MANDRIEVNNSELEHVVGGYFDFNGSTNILTYTHNDGRKTTHKILKYSKAWEMSNQMHGQNISEDKILAAMIDAKYVEG